MKIKASGKLIYNDDGEYVVDKLNISQLLDNVYLSNNKSVIFKIMEGCKILFDEAGNLRRKPDQDRINSYHICGLSIERELFYDVGKNLDIEIVAEGLVPSDRQKILC